MPIALHKMTDDVVLAGVEKYVLNPVLAAYHKNKKLVDKVAAVGAMFGVLSSTAVGCKKNDPQVLQPTALFLKDPRVGEINPDTVDPETGEGQKYGPRMRMYAKAPQTNPKNKTVTTTETGGTTFKVTGTEGYEVPSYIRTLPGAAAVVADCGPGCVAKKEAPKTTRGKDVKVGNDVDMTASVISNDKQTVVETKYTDIPESLGGDAVVGWVRPETWTKTGQVAVAQTPVSEYELEKMKVTTVALPSRLTSVGKVASVRAEVGASVKWMPGYEASKTYNTNTSGSNPTQTSTPTLSQGTITAVDASNDGVVVEGDTNTTNVETPVTVEGDEIKVETPVTVEGDEIKAETPVTVNEGAVTVEGDTNTTNVETPVTVEGSEGDTLNFSPQLNNGNETQILVPINNENGPGDLNDCYDNNQSSVVPLEKDPRKAMESEMLAKVNPRPVRPVAKISMDKSGHIRKVVITAEYKVA